MRSLKDLLVVAPSKSDQCPSGQVTMMTVQADTEGLMLKSRPGWQLLMTSDQFTMSGHRVCLMSM